VGSAAQQHDLTNAAGTTQPEWQTQRLTELRPSEFTGLRVVVVNDVASHWEVLAGVLHVLRLAGVRPTTLYTGTSFFPHDVQFFKWVQLDDAEVQALWARRLAAAPTARTLVVPGYRFNTSSLGEFIHIAKAPQMRVPSDVTAADLVICVSPELARGECRCAAAQCTLRAYSMTQ
jgi:hypothetical protein